MLNFIQQEIDKEPMEKGYRTSCYMFKVQQLGMDVYVVNHRDDLKTLKGILKKTESIFKKVCYEPTNILIVVGGISMGYMGSTHFYWPPETGETLGFALIGKDAREFWDLIEVFPFIKR